MSFPTISSRGGLADTNSTSTKINNILLSFYITKDDVANLDNMVEAVVEATSQEREENKIKKEASRKDNIRKNQQK